MLVSFIQLCGETTPTPAPPPAAGVEAALLFPLTFVLELTCFSLALPSGVIFVPEASVDADGRGVFPAVPRIEGFVNAVEEAGCVNEEGMGVPTYPPPEPTPLCPVVDAFILALLCTGEVMPCGNAGIVWVFRGCVAAAVRDTRWLEKWRGGSGKVTSSVGRLTPLLESIAALD
jgi:hypothetical protein